MQFLKQCSTSCSSTRYLCLWLSITPLGCERECSRLYLLPLSSLVSSSFCEFCLVQYLQKVHQKHLPLGEPLRGQASAASSGRHEAQPEYCCVICLPGMAMAMTSIFGTHQATRGQKRVQLQLAPLVPGAIISITNHHHLYSAQGQLVVKDRAKEKEPIRGHRLDRRMRDSIDSPHLLANLPKQLIETVLLGFSSQ